MELDAWFNEANTLIAEQASLPLISHKTGVIYGDLEHEWGKLWSADTAPPIPPHDPHKLNERFAVLNFLYGLANFALNEPLALISEVDADEIAETRALVRSSLNEAVRLLEVDECVGKCRVLRWEVINSCLIADWVRAEALLLRLAKEEGWEEGTSAKVSARLHLQSVWSEDEPQWPEEWWSPVTEPNTILAQWIYNNAVAVEPLFGNPDIKHPKELTPGQLRRVNLAVTGFERATRDAPLGPADHAALAWSYLAKAHEHQELAYFTLAARAYRDLLERPIPILVSSDQEVSKTIQANVRQLLLSASARCFQFADDLEEAKRLVSGDIAKCCV